MNEFYKTLLLNVKLNKSDVDDVKTTLDGLTKSKDISKDQAKDIVEHITYLKETAAVIDKLQRDLKVVQGLGSDNARQAEKVIRAKIKGLGGTPEDEQKEFEARQKEIKQQEDARQAALQGMLKGIATKFLQGLKHTFDDALDELRNMSDYSRMTNSNIRDLKLGYGFSSSQAYGFSQATSMLGIDSMEDLMWADSQQLSQFRRLFEKYSDYYEETMSPEYMEKQLEYQIAMQEFKMDLQHTVIDFFMNNKDKIMNLMDASMKFMEGTLQVLGWLMDFFDGNRARSETERLRETQSILNSAVANTKNSYVNQTNNFNNVSQADQAWLQNASQFAFKQVVDVYNRG